MDRLTVRIGEEPIKRLEAISERFGKSVSDMVREYVDAGIEMDDPRPPSGPQPPQQPAPRPVPPGQLPYALEKRLYELRNIWLGLEHPLAVARFYLWWPKVSAAIAALGAWLAYKSALSYVCLGAAALAVAGDALVKGRAARCQFLERSYVQVETLISAVPVLYLRLCLSKPPGQAEAEMLGFINERMQHLGEVWGYLLRRLRSG